jgi:hypothetical protein
MTADESGMSAKTRVPGKARMTGKTPAASRDVAAGEMPRSGKVSATAGMTNRTMAASKRVASRCVSATTPVTAATAARVALRQCRPSACQDQSQRANRQKNAFAPDAHDVSPYLGRERPFRKTYSIRP